MLEQALKDLTVEETIKGFDHPSQFCLKAFQKDLTVPDADCFTYEIKVYNKFMYYALVGGDIVKKVASSLSKWVNNRNPVIQERAKISLLHGYTRLELRFEHLTFSELDFYESAMQSAKELLFDSDSLRI